MGTRSWIVPGPQAIEIEQIDAVRIQLIGGRAEVVVHEGPGARIEVLAIAGHPLEVRAEDGRVSIGYPFLGWEGWLKRLHSYRAKDTAEIRVVVPRTAGVKAGTVLADVSVDGVDQDVSIGTASGALRLRGVRGAADLKAVSGAVTVSGHDGTLRVSTVSGAVSVAGSLPRVDLSTVSGAVAVETSLPTSVIAINAVSAGISVALPAGSGLVLTARNVSGKVLVDGVDRRTTGVTSVQDQHDETGCWLSVNNVSGNVDIRRGPVPAPAPDGAQDSPPDGAPDGVQDTPA